MPRVLDDLRAGGPDADTRRRLALKAFQHTASYDAAIAGWLAGVAEPLNPFPDTLNLCLRARRHPALRREPAPGRCAL